MENELKLEAEKLLDSEMNDLKGGSVGCDTCNKECQTCKNGGQ